MSSALEAELLAPRKLRHVKTKEQHIVEFSVPFPVLDEVPLTLINRRRSSSVPSGNSKLNVPPAKPQDSDSNVFESLPSQSQITHRLFIGSFRAAQTESLLRENDIKHIVSFSSPLEHVKVKSFDGIHYLRFEMMDHADSKIKPLFEDAIAFIYEGLRSGNVLVHCQFGISRSASVVIAFVMRELRLSRNDALAHVRSARSIVNPNAGFLQQLLHFQQEEFERINAELLSSHRVYFWENVPKQRWLLLDHEASEVARGEDFESLVDHLSNNAVFFILVNSGSDGRRMFVRWQGPETRIKNRTLDSFARRALTRQLKGFPITHIAEYATEAPKFLGKLIPSQKPTHIRQRSDSMRVKATSQMMSSPTVWPEELSQVYTDVFSHGDLNWMIIGVKPVNEAETVDEKSNSLLPSLSLPPGLNKSMSRSPSSQSIAEKLKPVTEINPLSLAEGTGTTDSKKSKVSIQTRAPQSLGPPPPSQSGATMGERPRSPSLGMLGNPPPPQAPTHACYLIAKGTGGIETMRDKFPDDKIAFGILSIEIGYLVKLNKTVMIVWPGVETSDVDKAALSLKPVIQSQLTGVHLVVTAFSRASLRRRWILQKLRDKNILQDLLIRVVLISLGEPTRKPRSDSDGLPEDHPSHARQTSSFAALQKQNSLVYVEADCTVAQLKQALAAEFHIKPSEMVLSTRTSVRWHTLPQSTHPQFGAFDSQLQYLDNDSLRVTTDFRIFNGDKLFVETSVHVPPPAAAALSPRRPLTPKPEQKDTSEHLDLYDEIHFEEHELVDAPNLHPQLVAQSSHSTVGSLGSQGTVAQERVRELEDEIAATGGEDLDPDQLIVVEENIGRGRTAVVHKGCFGFALVAIKEFQFVRLSEPVKEMFKKEVNLMRNLRHPNLVFLVGTVSDEKTLKIVMEWLPRGDLKTILLDKSIEISMKDSIQLALDIARGMKYLHEKRIIHRDLKCFNVLVDENWVAKVADFGTARVLEDFEKNAYTECGTSGWVAPEALEPPEEGYTDAVDVFSYAVCCWEILSREKSNPLSGIFGSKYAAKVREGLRPTLPEECPARLRDLVTECWSFEADKRPGFPQIVSTLESILSEQMGE